MFVMMVVVVVVFVAALWRSVFGRLFIERLRVSIELTFERKTNICDDASSIFDNNYLWYNGAGVL